MKTITKLFATALTAIALFSTLNLKAQQTVDPAAPTGSGRDFKFGVGINGGLFRNQSTRDKAYGADLKLQWNLSHYVALTASGGYTRLTGRNNTVDIDFIPAKGGVKVFPIKKMYLATEAGAGIFTDDGAKTNFIYSGGFGFEFGGFDIGARYEGYVNDSSSKFYFPKAGQYAIRLGYNFKL